MRRRGRLEERVSSTSKNYWKAVGKLKRQKATFFFLNSDTIFALKEKKIFHYCWPFILHEVKTHKNLKERKETEPSLFMQPRLIKSILLEKRTEY